MNQFRPLLSENGKVCSFSAEYPSDEFAYEFHEGLGVGIVATLRDCGPPAPPGGHVHGLRNETERTVIFGLNGGGKHP
jgi:hypothetical protein